MNKPAKVVLGVILVVVILALVYQQIEIENLKPKEPPNSDRPTATPNPTTYPTTHTTNKPTTRPPPQGYIEVPSAIAVANLNVIPITSNEQSYLLISGNVTNKTTNTLHNVGLHVYSIGYPWMGQPNEETLIDVTIPIASGSYGNGKYALSTLSPNESINVFLQVHSLYEYRTPTLYGNDVTLVYTG